MTAVGETSTDGDLSAFLDVRVLDTEVAYRVLNISTLLLIEKQRGEA